MSVREYMRKQVPAYVCKHVCTHTYLGVSGLYVVSYVCLTVRLCLSCFCVCVGTHTCDTFMYTKWTHSYLAEITHENQLNATKYNIWFVTYFAHFCVESLKEGCLNHAHLCVHARSCVSVCKCEYMRTESPEKEEVFDLRSRFDQNLSPEEEVFDQVCHACMCTYLYMYIYVYVYVHLCISMCVWMCKCMHMYM